MTSNTLDIPALAAEFTALHPIWNPQQQRLALALFRLLAQGEPVTTHAVASRAELPLAQAAAFVNDAPMLHREHGRVIAFGGLTLRPTSHVLEVIGRTLHTWCAFDTLFLPELLAAPARVRSTCPATGQTVTLTVDATGVHDLTPAGAVLSLHGADGTDLADVIGTFCCYVHFFAAKDAARGWTAARPGTYVVSVAEGYEFGRQYNHDRFAAVLDNAPR